MSSAMIGLYGVFLVVVGIAGNSTKLVEMLGEDGPGFIPWVIAILVLSVLAEGKNTRSLVMPFIALGALTFLLTNFSQISTQMRALWSNPQ